MCVCGVIYRHICDTAWQAWSSVTWQLKLPTPLQAAAAAVGSGDAWPFLNRRRRSASPLACVSRLRSAMATAAPSGAGASNSLRRKASRAAAAAAAPRLQVSSFGSVKPMQEVWADYDCRSAISICVCCSAHMPPHVHMCTHTHTHTYKHTHAHTHTHQAPRYTAPQQYAARLHPHQHDQPLLPQYCWQRQRCVALQRCEVAAAARSRPRRHCWPRCCCQSQPCLQPCMHEWGAAMQQQHCSALPIISSISIISTTIIMHSFVIMQSSSPSPARRSAVADAKAAMRAARRRLPAC